MDSQNMETRIDFLEYLGKDVSMHIMSCLDDSADLVRASSVSRSWHHFVISNEFAKKLCQKTCPQLSNTFAVAVEHDDLIYMRSPYIDIDTEQKTPEKGHQIYAALLHAIKESEVPPEDCTSHLISTSSSDRYPWQNLRNTMDPTDISTWRASYWSSRGQRNPDVPEKITYRIKSNTWLITEVDIQPFQAFFQEGHPIYSAKSVRIRVGHAKDPTKIDTYFRILQGECPEDDTFEWSYTSPEFPMAQRNILQHFKLPEPVLCMNGYLRIELLGRAQRQESDGLFYICLNHVRVLGRSLYPSFDVEVLQPDGTMVVKYDRENLSFIMREDLYGRVQDLYEIFS